MNFKIAQILELASPSAKQTAIESESVDDKNLSATELKECQILIYNNRKKVMGIKSKFLGRTKAKILRPILEDDTAKVSERVVLTVH